MKNSGIYGIENSSNGKVYVGSALKMHQRWWQHRTQLRAKKHHSILLQRAWDKHGEGSFVFKPILICKPENLLLYEQKVIDAIKPEYNVSKRAGSCLGVKHTLEARARMAAAKIGVKRSLEARLAVSLGKIGTKFTPQHCANMAAVRLGKKKPPHTEETKAKMRAAQLARRLREKSL